MSCCSLRIAIFRWFFFWFFCAVCGRFVQHRWKVIFEFWRDLRWIGWNREIDRWWMILILIDEWSVRARVCACVCVRACVYWYKYIVHATFNCFRSRSRSSELSANVWLEREKKKRELWRRRVETRYIHISINARVWFIIKHGNFARERRRSIQLQRGIRCHEERD